MNNSHALIAFIRVKRRDIIYDYRIFFKRLFLTAQFNKSKDLSVRSYFYAGSSQSPCLKARKDDS